MDSSNIAIYLDTLGGGGAERIMLDLSKEMTKRGHQVHFFILEDVVDYELPSGIVVHPFPSSDSRAKLTNPFNIKSTARTLTEQVKSVEGDIGRFDLHLVNLDSSNLVVSHCQFENTYHVVHNSLHQEIKRASRINPVRYWRTLREKRALHDKHLIAVSNGVKDELLSGKFITPKSVTTIYNPCDFEAISDLAAQPNDQIPSTPYLIHVGRVVRQKRHDILFQALQQVPDIPLVLLCKNVKKVRKIAKKYGVEDRVITPAFQSNPYNWIKNAKLMVFSSDFEGLGMVLIESLICGTPVVSTDCDFGPREILQGELSQYLAKTQDPTDLATKINTALKANIDLSAVPIISEVKLSKVTDQYLSLI